MRVSLQAQATIRWAIFIGLVLAAGLITRSAGGSAIVQWTLWISVGLTFLSAFVWPRCPHCGARVVQFSRRDWFPDSCWRCHRSYDEVETPTYVIAHMDAVTEAMKLWKKDREAAQHLLAEAERAHEAAAERELTTLREGADHDLLAARMLKNRLDAQLKTLALSRKHLAKTRETDPTYGAELRSLEAREKATTQELSEVQSAIRRLTSTGR